MQFSALNILIFTYFSLCFGSVLFNVCIYEPLLLNLKLGLS
ncbi:Uncharacterised protein [Legionella jordanis]|nr:Uncharacterised protein [Legionella jordanis]